ncbi:uncharacterized protein LOC127553574 [Antechinus flavipes]|uniref:uncharacterized protein LOC127553574 n=1 Tax=Antechinus flavipes TaxID=38775 RepID=UPI002236103C|nr:uncharacterized protein LOC127553574 [Antechinus flavipes]XP_051840335.1 uncharacterized protein LOC127553574 [Antechinus flavipes]
MGRRQKKLSYANQPQLLLKGYHLTKKVVIPCSSHQSISLCLQDYQSRSALMPHLNYQSRTKLSSHLDHKTLVASSPNLKLGIESAQLPQALQQAGVMSRYQCNYQATTTPSIGTTVLSLPCPDSWTRVPVPSEYQAALTLSSNHHVEVPSIPEHFTKSPSDSDHFPVISQGSDHRAEDQSCPDSKPNTTAVPSLNHSYQSTATTLQWPSQQTPAPQGTRTRSKMTTSLERYLNHWHRAIFSSLSYPVSSETAPSDSDHWVKGANARISCPDHFLKAKTSLLQHPEYNSWIFKASASSCSNQQVRASPVPPPCPNHRETITTFAPFESLNIPGKNPPSLHFEVRDTTTPSAQHNHQDIPLQNLNGNTEDSMIVPNHLTQVIQNREPSCNSEHLAKPPLGPDNWPMILPHLNCWTTVPQPAPDHTIIHYIDNQTKPLLVPKCKLEAPPTINPVSAEGLSPLKNCATSLPDSKLDIEVLPCTNQLTTSPTVSNQGLTAVSVPNSEEEVSMGCNHWAQAQIEIALDPNHWSNTSLESNCKVIAPQSPNCQDQILPDTDHQANTISSVPEHDDATIMVPNHWAMASSDTDQHVELESDPIYRGEATSDLDHVTGLLDPDNQTLTLSDTDLQNENITDLEHLNETIIVQDMITKALPASCHWIASIADAQNQIIPADLDYKNNTQIGFNHNIMNMPGHDHVTIFPIISEHQNEDTVSSHHQQDAESLVDYESKIVPDQNSMDILTLDHRPKTEEVPECGTLLSLITDYQDKNLSDCTDQNDDVLLFPNFDFEAIHPLDLDNGNEILLRTKHQSKMPSEIDHQTRVILDASKQAILPSGLDKNAKEARLDSDNYDKVSSFSPYKIMLPPDNSKPRKPSSYFDNGKGVSPNQNHRALQLRTISQTVTPAEYSQQNPQQPCSWVEVSLDSKHRIIHQQNSIDKLTPPSQLKSRIESHLNLDDQIKTLPGCKHQVKHQPFMNNWANIPSDLHPLNEDGENREPPWCLTYIKPYTIEGENITHRTVNNIIKSIPQEKIKNDIYKQILLQRIKDCSHFKNGLCLTSTYSVCLICASWIPYGCPHVQKIIDPCRAKLLSISSLLPGSKEEMSVKFVLQVPQLEAGSIFTIQYPDYSIFHHFYHKAGKSFHSQFSPSKSRTFLQEPSSKFTWLDFIRGKSYQPYGKKLYGSQNSLLGKMHLNSNKEEGTKKSEKVLKSLLERIQKKRSAN